MMPPGNWRRIDGSEYFVSDKGEVYSVARKKILAAATSSRGNYLHVNVLIKNRRVTCGVHRLVGNAFLGPLPDGMVTRHIDGDPRNNFLSNIQYGTQKENCADRKTHGTALRGEEMPLAKLDDEAVNEIRRSSLSLSNLAKKFNVSQTAVFNAKHRITWRHI